MTEIESLKSALADTQRQLAERGEENTRLRAALANSKDPCIYCQLPKDEMAKCKSGFPGCRRADDMTGCPEFGAMLNEYQLREQLAECNATIVELQHNLKETAAMIVRKDNRLAWCERLKELAKEYVSHVIADTEVEETYEHFLTEFEAVLADEDCI